MLLLSGVDNGDAVGEEHEGDDVLGLRIVARIAGEVSCIQGTEARSYEANRGLSWFSIKLPSKVGSAQSDATELIMLYRLLMLPLVDWNA